ncbi:MAG: DUF1318 domain-containing protein [Leptospira sp.]|nr:MAG: DUF1318 domain-containing protein [Leptospira sp.]
MDPKKMNTKSNLTRFTKIVHSKPISYFILVFILNQCSLKAPAITFTQTQTASEKQMIGEDKEIEKDGWLISSIKSSSSGSDLWQKDDSTDSVSDKELIIQLKKLAYLSPEISEWKDKGMIGESYDGTLKKNPKVPISPASNTSRIEELINLVNQTRARVLESKLAKEKLADPNVDLVELKKNLTLVHYQNVEPGQYFESSKSVWEKKD